MPVDKPSGLPSGGGRQATEACSPVSQRNHRRLGFFLTFPQSNPTILCCCSPASAKSAPGGDDAPEVDALPPDPEQPQWRPAVRSRPFSAGADRMSKTERMRRDLLTASDMHPQWMAMPGPYSREQKADIKAKWKALPVQCQSEQSSLGEARRKRKWHPSCRTRLPPTRQTWGSPAWPVTGQKRIDRVILWEWPYGQGHRCLPLFLA